MRWPLQWQLPGLHNVENALAAVGIAVAAGLREPLIRKVLSRFKGVEHRIELVRVLEGVNYVNDSKGTNVDSTRVAWKRSRRRKSSFSADKEKARLMRPWRR